MSEENKALGRREIEEIFNGTNLDAADEIYASDFSGCYSGLLSNYCQTGVRL